MEMILLNVLIEKKFKNYNQTWDNCFKDSSVWTKEHIQILYYFVLPNNESKIKHDIEQIRESDSSHVVISLYLKLQTEDSQENSMKELQCYITKIRQFGFNYIIIIGKRYCDILFMDCLDESEEYGQIVWGVLGDGTVFELDKSSLILLTLIENIFGLTIPVE
ncbi:hypothetical protein Glove_227g36 [Diversispora epigaea]|uniref:Uncharacterized protein n=1 Tax=Diversispora epigaea TaxID=1348612 RepID=A0A397IME0_9GLOM|nr:hypothetical protein Glove_227g36 [Diversispora epigaea]